MASSVVHVCEDEHGLWFVAVESPDGDLRLISFAGTRETMVEAAEQYAAEPPEQYASDKGAEVRVERGRVGAPKNGGLIPGYQMPEPRRVR